MIATKHDVEALLSDTSAHDAALAHLQCLMDERYQYDASGAWGVVEPNGLTRLGLTTAEAVALGAVDRAVEEPVRAGPTLEEAVSARIAEAARACDAVLAPFWARFSECETKTWSKQLAEAEALWATPSLAAVPESGVRDPIPTIRGITAVTGEPIADFVAAVLKNDEDWTRITTAAIGQRQALVARINAAAATGSVDAVLAIRVEINLAA